MDELVVKLKLEKIGNTSRFYSFTIYKTIEYSNDGTATAKVLEKALLTADGTVTLVVKPH